MLDSVIVVGVVALLIVILKAFAPYFQTEVGQMQQGIPGSDCGSRVQRIGTTETVDTIDYKVLYEAEKATHEALRAKIAAIVLMD